MLFETALLVFDDPCSVMVRDRIVDGEERWHTVGIVEGLLLLLVVHTMEEENGEEWVRIISARDATAREKRLYEESQ